MSHIEGRRFRVQLRNDSEAARIQALLAAIHDNVSSDEAIQMADKRQAEIEAAKTPKIFIGTILFNDIG